MKKEVVLISGARGLVAKSLTNTLSENYEIRLLTRKKANANEFEWNLEKQQIDVKALENVDHIIHLAGAGIVDKRWTKKRKLEIKDSRVATAQLILEALIKSNIKITSFISASAVGYYGTNTSDKVFTENDKVGNDFLSSVCYEWEQAAAKFTEMNVSDRTVILRMGMVLSKEGGALKKMIKPIKYGVGACLGKGNQYMPWIHIIDLCHAIKFIVRKRSVNGVFNIIAPHHVTNTEFIKILAQTMNKPLFLPNIPSWLVRIFFGEIAVLLLKGSRVSAKKIEDLGFNFEFSNLKSALSNL